MAPSAQVRAIKPQKNERPSEKWPGHVRGSPVVAAPPTQSVYVVAQMPTRLRAYLTAALQQRRSAPDCNATMAVAGLTLAFVGVCSTLLFHGLVAWWLDGETGESWRLSSRRGTRGTVQGLPRDFPGRKGPGDSIGAIAALKRGGYVQQRRFELAFDRFRSRSLTLPSLVCG